ncbi:Thylakoid lumenal protein - chloroplastic [Striga hermonthica]|uniref:Thylakoid lumenal protein - chloroplastic n=1 Tax=Striga hermonthica TaxID=68872 RepID=A0A9N7P2L5_STRHE|nr:Thylakoid lumenal protein - chloroplastic [Striga hermonthica]
MATMASISSLPLKSVDRISSSSSHREKSLNSSSKRLKPFSVTCRLDAPTKRSDTERKRWRKFVSTSLAAAAVIALGSANISALAELNKFEAETRGEFGIGSAAQFGSADLKKAVHVNENFRRANFTAADMRESDFSGSTFNGAYLEKAVAYKANFSGADLSDTLMDRMVLNEANLTNAVLVRSVLTRSDLGGAKIDVWVRELMNLQGSGWNEELIRRKCNDKDSNAILAIKSIQAGSPDRWKWLFDEKGNFSMASSYSHHKDDKANKLGMAGSSRSAGSRKPPPQGISARRA